MAETRQESLDRSVRETLSKRTNDAPAGQEMAAFQTAQQQLSSILAERQQNLGVAQAQATGSAQAAAVMSQAGQLAIETAAEGGGVQAVPSPAMSKFGLGKPQVQTQKGRQVQMTREGRVVINNNTITTTTNTVAGAAGPVQGRALAFKDPTVKFKTWMESAFASQDEERKKRDAEYRKRDWSLTKSANRMMKKIGEITSSMGKKLDPRTIGSTWTSQLKALLVVFGFTLLAANWKKVIKFALMIEKGIRSIAKWFGVGKEGNEPSPFVREMKYMLGGERDDERDLPTVFKELFSNKDDSGIIDIALSFFKSLYQDRKEAIRIAQDQAKPVGEVDGFPGLGGMLDGASKYIGQMLAAVFGGTEALKGFKATQERKKEVESDLDTSRSEFKDVNGTARDERGGVIKGVDRGDLASLEYTSKSGLKHYDTDHAGDLRDNLISGYRQGHALARHLNSGDYVGTNEILAGLKRIDDQASDFQAGRGDIGANVILPESLINALEARFGKSKEFEQIKREARGKGRFKFVVGAKSDSEVRSGKGNSFNLKNTIAGGAAGAVGGAAIGALGGGIGAVPGAWIGGTIGVATGAVTDTAVYAFQTKSDNTDKLLMVPESDPRPGVSLGKGRYGSGKDSKIIHQGYGFDKALMSRLKGYISGAIGYQGDTNFEFDMQDQDQIKAVDQFLKKRKGKAESDEKTTDYVVKLNDVDAAGATKKKRLSELGEKLKNSQAKKAYDRTVKPVVDAFDKAYGEISGKGNKSNRIKYLLEKLQSEGLTVEQAAGVAGNIDRESGFQHHALNPDDKGKKSGGLAQWRADRFEKMLAWTGKKNLRDTTYEDQVAYLINEMKTMPASRGAGSPAVKGETVMDTLKRMRSAEAAAHAFERTFEISADYKGDGNKLRKQYALSIAKGGTGNGSKLPEVSNNLDSGTEEQDDSGSNESPSLVQQMMGYVTDFMTNLPSSLEELSSKSKEVQDKVVGGVKNFISSAPAPFKDNVEINPVRSYSGKITQEFTDYNYYLSRKGEGNIKAGLSEEAWHNEVRQMTGRFPRDLNVNPEDIGSSDYKTEVDRLVKEKVRDMVDVSVKGPTTSTPKVSSSEKKSVTKSNDVSAADAVITSSNKQEIVTPELTSSSETDKSKSPEKSEEDKKSSKSAESIKKDSGKAGVVATGVKFTGDANSKLEALIKGDVKGVLGSTPEERQADTLERIENNMRKSNKLDKESVMVNATVSQVSKEVAKSSKAVEYTAGKAIIGAQMTEKKRKTWQKAFNRTNLLRANPRLGVDKGGGNTVNFPYSSEPKKIPVYDTKYWMN